MDPEQNQVDRLLRRGIFFSILWLMGVGSCIALWSGIKARRLITQSEGRLKGMGNVTWCFILGGLGLIIWIGALVVGIVDSFAHH
jgi:hypothetical protein